MVRHSVSAREPDRHEHESESRSHGSNDDPMTSGSVAVNCERLADVIASGEVSFPEDGDLELAMAVRVRRRRSLIELIARQIAAAMEGEWSNSE